MKEFKLIETKNIIGRGKLYTIKSENHKTFKTSDLLGQEISIEHVDYTIIERVKYLEHTSLTQSLSLGDVIGIGIYENWISD